MAALFNFKIFCVFKSF